METLSQLCERARTWASLRADGELSELEEALLDDHIERCASCAAFARGFEVVAGALRASDLERPAPLTLELPRRRSRTLLPLVLTALAVLASAVIAALLAPAGHRVAAKPVAIVAAAESPDRLRELRRPLLVDRRNRKAFGDSV
jgi:predicted anti-sigma-YlaC factor YlaD